MRRGTRSGGRTRRSGRGSCGSGPDSGRSAFRWSSRCSRHPETTGQPAGVSTPAPMLRRAPGPGRAGGRGGSSLPLGGGLGSPFVFDLLCPSLALQPQGLALAAPLAWSAPQPSCAPRPPQVSAPPPARSGSAPGFHRPFPPQCVSALDTSQNRLSSLCPTRARQGRCLLTPGPPERGGVGGVHRLTPNASGTVGERGRQGQQPCRCGRGRSPPRRPPRSRRGSWRAAGGCGWS